MLMQDDENQVTHDKPIGEIWGGIRVGHGRRRGVF
jgi:hypothetical protein